MIEGVIMMTDVFFKQFLMISDFKTILFLLVLVAIFVLLKLLQKKKVSFAARVLTATGIGLALGIVIQIVSGFSNKPTEIPFVSEVTKWYSLFGNGFIDLVRMLVIPLVIVSIIHVIINMKEGADIGKLARVTIVTTMIMVAIAVVVGLVLGVIFGLGKGMNITTDKTTEIKEVTSIVDTIRGLLPANPITAMYDTNVIAIVIFSAFFGIAAKRMSKKYMDVVKPFYDLINALQKIIISVAMSIIKLMPYAVVALLANTIAQRGIASIGAVIKFILVLYLAVFVMFLLQMMTLVLFKINPAFYLKKGMETMIMAFTSRSSVGTLPMTISTLHKKLGVSEGTANFVASFGTTAGMQGCAGVFPALLVVFVANMGGSPIDITFLIMSIIVISIGSLGIAGIPGTATMAASVALSGTGMASSFPLISPILAIDPIIDMGRTFLNVTGSMVNALIVDKILGHFSQEEYQDMNLKTLSDDTVSIE